MSKHIPMLRLMSDDEVAEMDRVRCKAKRGPRSKIRCEVYEGHNDAHVARGRAGQWYTW